MSDQNRMTSALFLSLILHALLLTLLQAGLLVPRNLPSAEELLAVDLVELPPPPAPAPRARAVAPPAPPPAPAPEAPAPDLLPETGIVPMPDAGEDRVNEKARFLSDRDNTVERESVRRGDQWEKVAAEPKAEPKQEAPPPAAKAAPADPQPAARAQRRPEREPEQIAALPKLEQLLPRPGDFATASEPAAPAAPAAAAVPERRDLLRGRPIALSSRPGVAAYLPTVQEGDITLLNTKASLFAPFVRRVAARVFQHLEIRLRQEASATVAGNGREVAEVEAIMSPSGEFLSAHVKQRRSETQLAGYRLLLGAANPEVFFDRNPPPGAVADDGNIHFILAIDLHVESAVDGESGRRGTGYYGVAGVGLL